MEGEEGVPDACVAGVAHRFLLKTMLCRVWSHVGSMLLMRAGLLCISLAVVAFPCLCHTAYQHACASTSSPAHSGFDVGLIQHVCLTPACCPLVVSCSACRRANASLRISTETSALFAAVPCQKFWKTCRTVDSSVCSWWVHR